MSADKPTLATFKIDKTHWLNFQSLASESGANATQVLRNFISACLDGRIDLATIQPIEQPTLNLDERIDERIDLAIAPLKTELQALHLEIANLPNILKITPSENALQGASRSVGVRSIVQESSGVALGALICPKCGSSDTIKKGDSIPNNRGEVGKLIKCKACGKLSTIR